MFVCLFCSYGYTSVWYHHVVLPHVLAACHRCSVPALNTALATAFALYLSVVAYTFGVMCAIRDSGCTEGFRTACHDRRAVFFINMESAARARLLQYRLHCRHFIPVIYRWYCLYRTHTTPVYVDRSVKC